MNSADLNDLLTPAAIEALSEELSLFRSRVLVNAYEKASEYQKNTYELSVSDILAGIKMEQSESVKARINIHALRSMMKKNGYYFIILGFLCLLAGVTMFFSTLRSSNLYYMLIALFVGCSGIISGFYGWYLATDFSTIYQALNINANSSMRSDDYDDAITLFIKTWNEIEINMRALISQTGMSSTANIPLKQMVIILRNKQLLSDEEITSILELLRIRNDIVHNTGSTIDEKLENHIKLAESIIFKLKENQIKD